jgi:hypothetical protein
VNCLLELTFELTERDGLPRDERKMKIVLQNRSNLSYVKNLGGAWTKDGELAFEFPSSLNALLYCFDRQMVDMQMVARFVDPAMNFSCSVSDARAGA